MSKEFIEKQYGSLSLQKAVRQQKQLSYLITSEVQEDIRVDYFEKYIERKYYTNDVFMNWVKQVLKEPNFLMFARYFRNPNPSSSLVNSRIKEPLSRVFFSEDSYFNYQINGKDVDYPKELDDDFQEDLFKRLIFNSNDIIVHDIDDDGEPYRYFLDIDKVVSIKTEKNKIKKIAYKACIEDENDEKIYGYAYLDDDKYEFYNKEKELIKSEPHDYNECPATFVSKQNFDNDPIVKESIFSHVRSELEDYSFFRTLQKMTEVNGAIPITVTLDVKEKKIGGVDFDGTEGEPMSLDSIGGQVSKEARSTAGTSGGSGILQPGSHVKVPVRVKEDGAVDMEFAKNFITFYNAPVDALEHLDKIVKGLENEIISRVVGDFSEGNEVSMTELQVSKGYVTREDKLRWLSSSLSFSRKLSDAMMLSLKYGRENVSADIFYGSDFFMETQDKLYDMFQKSPNSIERKNILIRLSQRRNMFNKEKSKKEVILYKLMPYTSDKDFELAVDNQMVSDVVFQFQTRFNYWIAQFETYVGDIAKFWESLGDNESNKIILINNMIYELINKSLTKTQTNGKESEEKNVQEPNRNA
jgi:hypothetical protein